jgi:hypothetical protein
LQPFLLAAKLLLLLLLELLQLLQPQLGVELLLLRMQLCMELQLLRMLRVLRVLRVRRVRRRRLQLLRQWLRLKMLRWQRLKLCLLPPPAPPCEE